MLCENFATTPPEPNSSNESVSSQVSLFIYCLVSLVRPKAFICKWKSLIKLIVVEKIRYMSDKIQMLTKFLNSQQEFRKRLDF